MLSCSHQGHQTEGDAPYYVNLTVPHISALKPLLLSDIADSIEYVQLEATDDCLLPRWVGIHRRLAGGCLFIGGDLIYKFDATTGKYLCTIGSRGQGPEEYASIQRLSILEDRQVVVIRDSGREYLTEFGFDGKYRGRIPLTFRGDSLLTGCSGLLRLIGFDDRYAAYYSHITPASNACQPNELILYDNKDEKIIAAVPNTLGGTYVDFAAKFPILMSGSLQDNTLYYKSFYNDTMYVIGKDTGINPFAVISLGDKKLPDEALLSRNWRALMKGKLMINNVHVNRDCIVFECFTGWTPDTQYFLCKYDKATGNVTYHSFYVMNDLDGGGNLIDFYGLWEGIVPVYMQGDFEEVQRDIYFSSADKSQLKYPDMKDAFEQMQQARDEDDNPLLMILKLKK
jgi:hypothetical protein